MDRRSLVLRRFGSLDFGLGYFENGAWIDHTTIGEGVADLGIADSAFAAIHDLLGCCASPAATAGERGAVRTQRIAVQPVTLAATLVDRRDHVQPVARRSSAG